MKRIKITDPNNPEEFPQFQEWTQRVTKVELHFLDGTTKEMKLYFPNFTAWGEAQEITNNYLGALVRHWTKFWLKIKSYQVSLGSVKQNGEEKYSIHYGINEIPLNMIYTYEWPKGKWEDPNEVLERDRQERVKEYQDRISNGKNALTGKKNEENPKQPVIWLN